MIISDKIISGVIQTYYTWKSKYGGMGVSDIKRLKELEEENSKLKRIYAAMALEYLQTEYQLSVH